MRGRPKYSASSGKIWKSFTSYDEVKLLNGNLDNNFQISEQKYKKIETVGNSTPMRVFTNDIIVDVKHSLEL